MNRVVKKAAAVILTAAMMLTFVPFTWIDKGGFINASAVVEKKEKHKISGDFIYTEETARYSKTNGITIVRYTGNSKNVVVPEEIDGKPVTCIGVFCFAYYTPEEPDRYWYSPFANQIESIELPDTVEVIDEGAFKNCMSLKSINIPDSIRVIRGAPFEGCESLNEITLSGTDIYCDEKKHSSYEFLNKDVSGNPDFIKTVFFHNFPDSYQMLIIDNYEVDYDDESKMWICKYAEEEAPENKAEEKSYNDYNYFVTEDNGAVITKYNGVSDVVSLPCSINNFPVVGIGAKAFKGTGILKVVIPDSVKAIGDYAFHGCECLKNIVIPASVEKIGCGAFGDCSGLEAVEIPEAVTEIKKDTFAGCESLKEISIRNSVARIGRNAFSGCKSLEEIIIPDSVTEIGSYAFEECEKLKKAVLPDSLTKIGAFVFSKCSALEEINWPSSMKYVPTEAFACCHSLKDFSPFTGVEIICGAAFYDCKNLIIDDFGNNIRKIGSFAFETEFLQSGAGTVIGDSDFSKNLEYIGSSAFESCSFPDEIIIPEKVDYIGEAAFMRAAVKKATIKAPLKEISSNLFRESGLSMIDIPDSVERIGEGAFMLSLIESIEIPSHITVIGNKAFEQTKIKKVVIPPTVKTIGESAFGYCLSLKEITIENGVKSIGKGAFMNCPAAELTIPESVAYLGDDVLKGSSVKTLYYNAIKAETTVKEALNCAALKNIIFGDKVSNIPQGLFQNCSGIEEIILPESVESIGFKAFSRCTSLKKIVLSNGISVIDGYAFEKCTALTEITLPESLKLLNGKALADCTGIKTVNFNASACEFTALKEAGADGIYYSPFAELPSLEKINIGENVKELPGFLFAGIKNVGEIELPTKVTDIGTGAFALSGITGIKATKNLESIEEYSFYGCENLKSIDLTSKIMLIGEAAFSGSGITSIYLPDSVTNIEMEAFKDCSALESVRMSANVDFIPREAFFNCTKLSSFTWDSESKLIGRLAFGNCEKLVDFDFMNVEKLYVNSFLGSGVSTVQLGENTKATRTPLTTIEVQSFKDCDNLQVLGIGGNVSSIKNQAFADCSNLETAVIADSVTSIANDAFDGCDKLTIYCSENSYARSYAQANGIRVSTLVIAPIPNQIYTGFEIKPAVSVSASGNKLYENVDFGVTYSNNINVGNADVTVNGKGDFRMFASKAQFTIVTKSIADVTVTSIADQPYTGSAVTPELIVTDGLKVLSENKDYTLSYSNNKNEGTAKVKITGIGNYSGSTSAEFNIVKKDDIQSFIRRFIYKAKVFFTNFISFFTNIFIP